MTKKIEMVWPKYWYIFNSRAGITTFVISTETFCVSPVGKKKVNSAAKPSVIRLVLLGRAIALNPTVVNVEWVGLDPIVPNAYAYPDV